MTRTLWAALAVVAVLGAIQLVPVDTSNPPLVAPLVASAEVQAVLDRACYDCHSNETRWPWYSRVAPASWLVSWDVRAGRDELNFSDWGGLPADEQKEKLEEAWEEIDHGHMPLWYYLWFHSEARLSAQDREVLRGWMLPADAATAAQGTEPAPQEHGADHHHEE
jgi:hypothetical protein